MNLFDPLSQFILALIGQDNQAIILCRSELPKLEKEIEALRNAPSWRRVGDDAKQIMSIKEILNVLMLNHAGVVIKHPELEKLINRSLHRIRQYESDQSAPQNYPAFVGVDLGELWGSNEPRYSATKIQEIRTFMDAGFFKRVYLIMQIYIAKIFETIAKIV